MILVRSNENLFEICFIGEVRILNNWASFSRPASFTIKPWYSPPLHLHKPHQHLRGRKVLRIPPPDDGPIGGRDPEALEKRHCPQERRVSRYVHDDPEFRGVERVYGV